MPNKADNSNQELNQELFLLFSSITYDELEEDLDTFMASAIRDEVNDNLSLSRLWDTYVILRTFSGTIVKRYY